MKEYRARAEEIRRRTPLTIGEQVGEGFKGVGSGIANLLESGALGAATILPEKGELALENIIQSAGDVVQDYLAPDERVGGISTAIPRKFGEALGSFGGILGASIINPIAGGALAVGAGAGEASERAREGEATEEERAKASRLGAVVGASELISPLRIIGKFKAFRSALGDELATDIISKARRIRNEAGVEGLQEFAASVAQNFIERGIYNPEQGAFEGSKEAFGYGAGVGGFVQTIVEMIAQEEEV